MTDTPSDTVTASGETAADDQWLTALFSTAAGPFVDSAFAERILGRLRRRERLRVFVIVGTGVLAALLTIGLATGLAAGSPVFDVSLLRLPSWLASSSSAVATGATVLAGLAVWMVAEEA